jgi:hypothetical protein
VRWRHLLLLLPLALLPVLLAVLLRDHKSARPVHLPTAVQVSLRLKSRGGNAAEVACGTNHHFAVFPSGATIKLSGEVQGVAVTHAWSVKVKFKACSGGQFRAAGDTPARLRRDGTYKGSFTAPVPGFYFARALLKLNGRDVARSDKRYFRIGP